MKSPVPRDNVHKLLGFTFVWINMDKLVVNHSVESKTRGRKWKVQDGEVV